jgi:DNA repair exonuclease SbcCD nuclease subunit
MTTEALTRDVDAINKRLEELALDCHVVSPSRHFDVIAPGWGVSLDFVKVDPKDPREAIPSDDERKLTLSAKKMQEIGRAAGIDWDPKESGRKGDRSDPRLVEYVAVGHDKGVDGSPRRCVGEVVLDLRDDSAETRRRIERALARGRDPETELGHDRAFIHRAAETQAQARAVANGLGLRRDYTPEELQKPFAIARMVFVGERQKTSTQVSLYNGPPRRPESFRFALVGDTHRDDVKRAAEHDRVMAFVSRDAAERGCDVMLHSGDVWERATTTATERRSVADYVQECAERMPCVVVPGNHDNEMDVEWLGRLKGRHPIHAVTSPRIVTVGTAAIACLPWPRKGSLLAKLGILAREEGNQVATEALRATLRELGDGLSRHHLGPRIFLGHCSMRGSKTSEAQPPLVGHDFELTLEDLAIVGASFYALGHIHQGQELKPLFADAPGTLYSFTEGKSVSTFGKAFAPVVYPGSPRRCNFGEPEPKGYVVGEFEGDRLVSWERIPTPCAPMLTVDVRFERGSLVLSNEDANLIEKNPGAEVKIRYDVPADQRVAAKAAGEDLAELLKVCGGAAKVDLDDTVIAETRARAPEVAAARTMPDQLVAHWTSTGFEPGERRGRLLEMARFLEEKVRDAA